MNEEISGKKGYFEGIERIRVPRNYVFDPTAYLTLASRYMII